MWKLHLSKTYTQVVGEVEDYGTPFFLHSLEFIFILKRKKVLPCVTNEFSCSSLCFLFLSLAPLFIIIPQLSLCLLWMYFISLIKQFWHHPLSYSDSHLLFLVFFLSKLFAFTFFLFFSNASLGFPLSVPFMCFSNTFFDF